MLTLMFIIGLVLGVLIGFVLRHLFIFLKYLIFRMPVVLIKGEEGYYIYHMYDQKYLDYPKDYGVQFSWTRTRYRTCIFQAEHMNDAIKVYKKRMGISSPRNIIYPRRQIKKGSRIGNLTRMLFDTIY